MIHVGTSGFQYPPWRGRFYPKDLPAKKMLPWYAEKFDTVEVNSSFYKKPTAEQLRGWAKQVSDQFIFSMKAWQRITHQKRLRDCEGAVNLFARAVRSLKWRLGPVLYQVPPNLEADTGLLREFLSILPRDLDAAFEFRHESWFREPTWKALADAQAALCIADTEELRTPPVHTIDWGYFRLRRLDYDDAALRRWAGIIRGFGDAYVYFRHEDTALGPKFASQMLALT